MSDGKVIPRPDDLNLEFFQAIVRAGKMCVQRCEDCGHHSHPPRYHCGDCFSGRYSFVPVSGAGTVYSHTLSHFTTEAAWKDEVPYQTVVVELDEGPRIVGSGRFPDPAGVRIGQRVRVLPEPRTEDFAFFAVVPEEAVVVPEEER